MRNMTTARTIRTAGAAAALALVLAGCGGDTPSDASAEEFCSAYTEGLGDAMGAIDPEAPEDEQAEAAVEAFQEFADRMKEVGTPEDMSAEAREGFELSLDSIEGLSADDLQDEDALAELETELSGDDKAAAEALQAYVSDNCDLGLPEDLSSQ